MPRLIATTTAPIVVRVCSIRRIWARCCLSALGLTPTINAASVWSSFSATARRTLSWQADNSGIAVMELDNKKAPLDWDAWT
jgi:hypothetical protein